MDLENQARIKALAEKYGREHLVVISGGAEAEASGLAAETVTNGDPTYAGPLAGVQLELPVYHIFELQNQITSEIWEAQISLIELVLDVDAIKQEVATNRIQK